MANNLTFEDCAVLMNSLAGQVLGDSSIAVTDFSSFVNVGQTVLKTGYDPILGAISQVLTTTVNSYRAYNGKLLAMRKSDEAFGAWRRKLNAMDKPFPEGGDPSWSLNDGQSVDQYKVNKPRVVQMNFYGVETIPDSITVFDYQLNSAFSSPQGFSDFWAVVMGNLGDKHGLLAENKARATLCNLVLGVLAYAGADSPQVIHLLTEYNELTGESFTPETIRAPENYAGFMRFAYARIQVACDKLTDRTYLYHWGTDTIKIPRHTPYDLQVTYMYAPELRQMEARVLTDAFNPEHITFNRRLELVNMWQSSETPGTIKGRASYSVESEGEIRNATSDEITVDNLFAVIIDEDAAGVVTKLERMAATPYNAAGAYHNLWYHWAVSAYNDFTENVVIALLD